MANEANAVLEEVLEMALQHAQTIRAGDASDFDAGRLSAFYEVVSVIKEQADMMGVVFNNQALNDLVPEDLLKK